jgi:hypothetical protein
MRNRNLLRGSVPPYLKRESLVYSADRLPFSLQNLTSSHDHSTEFSRSWEAPRTMHRTPGTPHSSHCVRLLMKAERDESGIHPAFDTHHRRVNVRSNPLDGVLSYSAVLTLDPAVLCQLVHRPVGTNSLQSSRPGFAAGL